MLAETGIYLFAFNIRRGIIPSNMEYDPWFDGGKL